MSKWMVKFSKCNEKVRENRTIRTKGYWSFVRHMARTACAWQELRPGSDGPDKEGPPEYLLQIFGEGQKIHNLSNFLGHNHIEMQRIWDSLSQKKEREGIKTWFPKKFLGFGNSEQDFYSILLHLAVNPSVWHKHCSHCPGFSCVYMKVRTAPTTPRAPLCDSMYRRFWALGKLVGQAKNTCQILMTLEESKTKGCSSLRKNSFPEAQSLHWWCERVRNEIIKEAYVLEACFLLEEKLPE